jgi:AcrR family transcriptional regulator
MPRQPDPNLEGRILKAAHVLWKRGGSKALTMRAVARSAGTNTPSVYRRFPSRQDLIRGLLRRIVAQIQEQFQTAQTVEEFAETYVDNAVRLPHEYELFYSQARWLSPPKGAGEPRPIRESRPNFALLESMLAQQLGGKAEEHTQLALAIWAALHGTAMLLLSKAIPEGHGDELRLACREAVTGLIREAGEFGKNRISLVNTPAVRSRANLPD